MPIQSEVFYTEMVFLCIGFAPVTCQQVEDPKNTDKNVCSMNTRYSKEWHPEGGGKGQSVAKQGFPFEGLACQEQHTQDGDYDQIVVHAFLVAKLNRFQGAYHKITARHQKKRIDGDDWYAQ